MVQNQDASIQTPVLGHRDRLPCLLSAESDRKDRSQLGPVNDKNLKLEQLASATSFVVTIGSIEREAGRRSIMLEVVKSP